MGQTLPNWRPVISELRQFFRRSALRYTARFLSAACCGTGCRRTVVRKSLRAPSLQTRAGKTKIGLFIQGFLGHWRGHTIVACVFRLSNRGIGANRVIPDFSQPRVRPLGEPRPSHYQGRGWRFRRIREIRGRKALLVGQKKETLPPAGRKEKLFKALLLKGSVGGSRKIFLFAKCWLVTSAKYGWKGALYGWLLTRRLFFAFSTDETKKQPCLTRDSLLRTDGGGAQVSMGMHP